MIDSTINSTAVPSYMTSSLHSSDNSSTATSNCANVELIWKLEFEEHFDLRSVMHVIASRYELKCRNNDGLLFMDDTFKLCKTPVRHTLQPLCDLSATDNFHRSQRSQQGPRSVLARLQRSRRLIGDLVATKSVAARFLCLHKNLAATDLVADRSRRSRRSVAD